MISREFEGRKVLVTGGSSGLGLAVAAVFAREGARVGIIAFSETEVTSGLDMLRGSGPPEAFVGRAADVSDETALRNAVDAIAGELGGLDHVVNSAGIAGKLGQAVEEVTAADFLKVLQINVLGSFLVAKAALPYLKKGTHPSCVLIGSDSGFVSTPGMLAYNASKGAVVQLTRALSVELHEPFGIRVNSVCPSIMDTPMARTSLGITSFEGVGYPVSSPDDIATIVLMLASNRSLAVNGVSLLADFGYSARSSFPA